VSGQSIAQREQVPTRATTPAASAGAAEAPAAQAEAPGAPVPVEPEVSLPEASGGLDWGEIVEQLGVNGMARMLAQYCELVKFDSREIALKLPRAHERLLEKPYQERLKSALQKRYGASLKVSISIGEGNGNSPAAIADRERQEKEARAIAEIEQDPFVRELVENFDARVNEASIKPIQ
jgi:DNA polymerase-3 subunit gamma/tau